MSQVIIVSNRLPISVKKENGRLNFYPSLGGLATGLSSYVKRDNVWIGWPGIASDGLTNKEKQEIVKELGKHNYNPVFLSQKQIDDFYNGYSNQVLWPNFHSLRQSSHKSERQAWWRAYRKVNKQFAQVALNLSITNGRVWVHDYQLLLMPEMLKAERPDLTLGLFVHIPFPDVNGFDKLAEKKKLLKGMLGADVIGFHTQGYVDNFINNAGVAGADLQNKQLVYEGRIIRVSDFPMGIDYEKYASANKTKAVKTAAREYAKRYKGQKVIVAVDRLDPSKGLIERLSAYELFLKTYPKMRGKVVFSMVAAPSRIDVPAYKNLSKKITQLVDSINKKYGTAKWQPVDYIDRAVPFEEVSALFRIADVAFIAPLKDGMNLAAKEYVASAKKNGVLILSETAGASEELQDALLVNPKEPEALVDALYRALTMRRRELRRRLRSMKRQLAVNTVHEWAHEFVGALQNPVSRGLPLTRTFRTKLQAGLVKDFRTSQTRLFFLDYDGSLVPFSENYSDANPSNSLLELINNLSHDDLNDVVLISGRRSEDLERWFGSMPLHLVAEHGAFVKKPGDAWQEIEKPDTAWKEQVLPILEKYTALTPGARIEKKPHTLVWHYRGASPYYAQKYAVTIKRVLRPILKAQSLELMQGNKVLEVKNPQISKGKAADRWLGMGYDFIFAIGDDKTDEELFAVLPSSAYSIKVGRGRTFARFRIASYKDTIKLLKKLTRN